jgi:ectoine hydroxylase-related dioxygenase (phytanoyl-CoA dioxygenase family)
LAKKQISKTEERMAVDLSTKHELINDLFQIPQDRAGWEQYALTQEQIDFYRENGYLSGVQMLNKQQVQQLREELTPLFQHHHPGHELWYEYHSNESSNPDSVLFHALGAWRIQPAFHDSLWNPAFTKAASQLLGGAVRFWHDQLFCKPAKHGGVVAWHQDYSYWTRTKPMNHLTCWIGLDDSTRENGCLFYVPKSHEWTLLPITGLAGDMNAIRDVLTPAQWEQFQRPVAIELQAGQCSFHHPLLVHGSFENRTERPRRALVLNVFLDGTKSDSAEVLLTGVPPIAPGEKMSGQFFPLLFDPARN